MKVSLTRAENLLQFDVVLESERVKDLTHIFSYYGGSDGTGMNILSLGPDLATRWNIHIGGLQGLPEIVPPADEDKLLDLLDYICVFASINAWRIDVDYHRPEPALSRADWASKCEYLGGRYCDIYSTSDSHFREYLDRGFVRALEYVERTYMEG